MASPYVDILNKLAFNGFIIQFRAAWRNPLEPLLHIHIKSLEDLQNFLKIGIMIYFRQVRNLENSWKIMDNGIL